MGAIYEIYANKAKCRGEHLIIKNTDYCHFCKWPLEILIKEAKKVTKF